ncbi:MAG: LLM class flavin-dependent oxidoreductase, partial [Candidatus Binatia bacterium]
VKVGVLVTGNTYRHPALLAKMAATVDHVSNGRLILGLGAAWFELEHTAYGIPFYTPGERARRLKEAVEVLKLLFTQEKTTFAGKYYQLKDAMFEPKAVQKPYPPLLIGGMGPKLIQPLAAQHADIWHFFVRDGDPQATKQLCTDFDALCRKVGRDPAQVEKSTSLRPPQLTGGEKEVRQRIQTLADAGVQHFILSIPQPTDREILRRFALEVMPAFRSA